MEEKSEAPPPPTLSISKTLTLTDLNGDMLSHCASFLSLSDVVNLAMTCKPLRYAAYIDAVWRRLYTERWPFQCVASGAEGVRDLYLDRFTAVNQLKFSDPVRKIWSQHPIPYSHILLKKNEAFLAQGAVIQKVRFESAKFATCHSETLTGHNARITCVRLLPANDTSLFRSALQNEEDALVTSSSDRTIRIWWKGRSYRCFKGHNGPVTTLADTLLGNRGSKVLASGGEDCTVRIWSLNKKNHSLMMTLHGHERPISLLSVARHKTSLLVSMSTDSRVRVWDTTSTSSGSSSCVGMVGFPGTPVGMKCYDTMCYIAVGSSVTAIDIRTMQKVLTAAVLPTKIHSFEMLPSKLLICTGGVNKALLWDIRKNQSKPLDDPVSELDHIGQVTMLHMDPVKVVTGGPSDYNANVWETGTGVLTNQLDCRSPDINEDDYYSSSGLSSMAVDGCRIFTSSTGAPGDLYFRDFSNCSVPINLHDENPHSKFWDIHSSEDEEF